MASLDEYNFTTISDRVMHQIRSDILNGEFKAGQKLILSDLKDRYNVGGSPLREAMVQLSWQKYVTMKPQKGFWVADVSLNELKSIIKARLAIGNVALRDAMDNGDEKWELNILTTFHKLCRLDPSASDFDSNLWERRHKEFHMAIIACKGAEFVMSLMSSIYDQQERYRHILLSSEFTYDSQYYDNNEHEAIMKAVLDRNFDLASDLVRQHTEKLYQVIEKIGSLQSLKTAS
ncbi:TPA: FCD domain-containing protein [Photobacterium damselae]|uniref:FCD domain-containing protein n=2 Tax=Photobacterium damselae TaxID=38293 RepID=A0ABD6X483_PHODM|nr:FCD domain-containing protein [Photobacterium damselae]EJN6961196.1 FCD domain-containing protein [Photobacterium damselae]MCG3845001.1 FCD domain-containing protein [Photobacterium damselae]MCG9778347.1 FCD domain-containing protein [Photobacterium damselae]PSU17332.1 FCD domain-containing protein [Photobacterium damselae]UKA12734.1 FCD domain-containing protein [Photobacterium damselae subsp. damselae]